MDALFTTSIEKAIDKATRAEEEAVQTLRQTRNIQVDPIQDWSTAFQDWKTDLNASTYLETKTPWHFGLSLKDHQTKKRIGIITFHFAYSSWNGRILYVDCLQSPNLEDDDERHVLLLRILANIAVTLDCARLTWRVSSLPILPVPFFRLLNLSCIRSVFLSLIGYYLQSTERLHFGIQRDPIDPKPTRRYSLCP